MRPGPNPTAGFLLAGFVLCMFISTGIWGALSPVLPPKVAVSGALVTGSLLFVAAANSVFWFLGRDQVSTRAMSVGDAYRPSVPTD